MLLRDALLRFMAANRSVCERLAGRLPHTRANAFDAFVHEVVSRTPSGGCVLDAGAGEDTPFAAVGRAQSAFLVGIDLSRNALARNETLDAAVAADLDGRAIPLRPDCADVIASRSFLEHLPQPEAFFRDCARVLRDGGSLVCLAPCRYSWFALLNRLLPRRAARALLFALHPESKEVGGMVPYYTDLHPAALRRGLSTCGFEAVTVKPFYGTNYGYAFVPLFILTSLLELTLQALHLERFCSTMLVVAARRAYG